MACHGLDRHSYIAQSKAKLEEYTTKDLPYISDISTSSQFNYVNIPLPPPLPRTSYRKTHESNRRTDSHCSLDGSKKIWDRLFNEGYEADVHVLTDDKYTILAHSNILGITSAVLRSMLDQAIIRGGYRCIKIQGVPSEAVRAFIRFLYSSRYEEVDMMKYGLHLLVMSHAFRVPSLKSASVEQLERVLNTENVTDVLQLARECDAPRLSVMCIQLIINDFKNVSLSEGWKVMKKVNPSLEQEILETLVEADSKRQEKMKKMDERKMYIQLNEAMEALKHICTDGCSNIGPRDKTPKDTKTTCNFPACRVLESLIRHFSVCKARVLGGCQHCKRLWQLFELHSCMCSEPESCKVPLCRHFKEKAKSRDKKEEMKWRLLVRKVTATKGTISSISAWRSFIAQDTTSNNNSRRLM